jgi:hypothetical protein
LFRGLAISVRFRTVDVMAGNKQTGVGLGKVLLSPCSVQIMNLRIVFSVVGLVLVGAILIFAGGFGEIELLVDGQCGATGYLCEPPTADIGHEKDPVGPLQTVTLHRAPRPAFSRPPSLP